MGERLADLAIEVRSGAVERVVDRILGELQAWHIVAKEALDVPPLEISAKVRACAIEHSRHRESDAVGCDALEIADDVEAKCILQRAGGGLRAPAAQRE